ncbi:hypothetical protein SAMN04487788_1947 [Microbacterium testaceum StLB037]|uniref:Peptidase S74 domain-containing protein n=1 Tax=Microbacterium testaceum (strain StLB037) TaxID=979556 RepID=A0A1H0PRA5_MICTS|nr:hypothetical protein [Microbacterium testaceum]SDP07330.1 hypothetical protein SAMN04487788_1947 [Microbacterium testaceum StLB037]
MATGDDALAAGMDVVPGTADRRLGYEEINKTRDYIAQRTATVTPVSKGGTGATTAAQARANLDVAPASEVGKRASINALAQPFAVAQIETNPAHQLGMYYSDGAARPVVRVDQTDITLASKGDTDAALTAASNASSNADGRVAKGGDTMTGNLFLPNSTAATASWQVAYINGDGRLCRGSSSQRYKKYISAFEPEALGDIWPALQRYQMRSDGIMPGDGKWHYGYIAEQMSQHPDQDRFVVYRDVDDTGEQVPDSIDFIGLLLAQTAQLHEQLANALVGLDLAHQRIAQLEQGA